MSGVSIGGTAPAVPSALALGTGLSATDNDSTPTITVTVGETGGTVALYTNSNCTVSASTETSVTDTDAPITVDITATALSSDGAVSYYAEHTKNSRGSGCSTAKVDYTYDSNRADYFKRELHGGDDGLGYDERGCVGIHRAGGFGL